MKFTLPLLLLLTSQNVIANQQRPEFCLYADNKYSVGSILKMGSSIKECRNGLYEHNLLVKKDQETKGHSMRPFRDYDYEWRTLINNTSEAK